MIYAVEGQPPFRARTLRHIAALEAAGHRFVISELTRTECLIKPLGSGDGVLLLSFLRSFHSANLRTVTLTLAMHERAAMIRGTQHYAGGRSSGLADSLHLAAAIEVGCDRFLTNDHRLASFPDLAVEELP